MIARVETLEPKPMLIQFGLLFSIVLLPPMHLEGLVIGLPKMHIGISIVKREVKIVEWKKIGRAA